MTTAGVISPERAEVGPDLRLVAEPTPEYGRWEQASLPVDQIITVSQTRPGINPEHEHLVESIDTNGLLNPLDVAVLDREKMADYLNFVAEMWGDTTNIDELTPAEDGSYYLLIAGHSRLGAINVLEWRRQVACAENGQEYLPANVLCKLHEQPSPQEIIAIQLAENIHNQPPAERTAMALVETFEYGKRHGLWESKADYVRQCEGKFSAYALNQALHFASLPSKARDFAFAGSLSYQTAVELGRQKDLLDEYYTKLFETGDEAQTQELVDLWYGRQVLAITNKNFSTAKAKLYIKNQVASFKEFLANEEPVLDIMIDVASQAEEYRQQQIRAYRRELAELEAKPLQQWQRTVQLHRAIIGSKPDANVLDTARERVASAAADVGAGVLALELA